MISLRTTNSKSEYIEIAHYSILIYSIYQVHDCVTLLVIVIIALMYGTNRGAALRKK